MSLGHDKPHTNLSTLKLVYYALAYPYIQYCISSWGGACKTSLQPLFIKQKLIVKTMLYEKYTSPSSPLFHKLGMLKLSEVYNFQIGKLMFNQIKKKCYHFIKSFFSLFNTLLWHQIFSQFKLFLTISKIKPRENFTSLLWPYCLEFSTWEN